MGRGDSGENRLREAVEGLGPALDLAVISMAPKDWGRGGTPGTAPPVNKLFCVREVLKHRSNFGRTKVIFNFKISPIDNATI